MNRLGRPGGVTLPELIVSLVLLGFMAALGARSIRALTGSGRILSDRVEVLEADRVLQTVLREEFARVWGGEDWELTGDGALRVRSFRWTGWGCGAASGPVTAPTGGVVWEARLGITAHRRPSPKKDSVLVLTSSGLMRRGVLLDLVADGTCSGAEALRVRFRLIGGVPGSWGLGGAVPGAEARPLFVRGFESREYLLVNGAFRLRRGLAGRQPLTSEVYGSGSSISVEPDGSAHFLLTPVPSREAGAQARLVRLFPPAGS